MTKLFCRQQAGKHVDVALGNSSQRFILNLAIDLRSFACWKSENRKSANVWQWWKRTRPLRKLFPMFVNFEQSRRVKLFTSSNLREKVRKLLCLWIRSTIVLVDQSRPCFGLDWSTITLVKHPLCSPTTCKIRVNLIVLCGLFLIRSEVF